MAIKHVVKKKRHIKKKRRLNLKRVALFILIIVLIVYFIKKFISSPTAKDDNSIVTETSSNLVDVQKTQIIKLSSNENYLGNGQKVVENQDGYFMTFTTLEKSKKTYKEYKQNGNASWSEKSYWGGTMAENACGITSMSIILSGYGKDITPDDLRKKYSPSLNNDKIPKELKNYGIKNSGFFYDEEHLSNDYIIEHLKSDKPILVCVWNKPSNNRWTTASHYMVLLATDSNGQVYVSNPNGLENDSKSSGWYDINEITNFLAKALFVEE